MRCHQWHTGQNRSQQHYLFYRSAATWYALPVAGIVLLLLFAITMSYRQIINAYPSGGGAYVVATKKLGTSAGLVAGGSLFS